MRKDTSAAVRAGVLVNLLFTLGPFMVIFSLAGSFSTLFFVSLLAVALFASVFGVVSGAIVGYVFVKTLNRLHLSSTYLKSLIFAMFIWAILVIALPIPIMFLLMMLASFLLEGLCFAYLFSRWTKSGQEDIKPPSTETPSGFPVTS